MTFEDDVKMRRELLCESWAEATAYWSRTCAGKGRVHGPDSRRPRAARPTCVADPSSPALPGADRRGREAPAKKGSSGQRARTEQNSTAHRVRSSVRRTRKGGVGTWMQLDGAGAAEWQVGGRWVAPKWHGGRESLARKKWRAWTSSVWLGVPN